MQINTLKGKFGVMITTLKENNTVADFTLAGMDLIPSQIRALVRAVELNRTLKTLSISRKNI